MIAAFLLFLIAGADLVRRWAPVVPAVVAITVIWLGAVALVVFGVGGNVIAVLLAVLVAGGWLASTSPRDDRHPRFGLWPVAMLIAAVVVFTLIERSSSSPHLGFLVDWHADAPAGLFHQIGLPTLATAIAVVLFLIESGNVIVRITLGSHPPSPDAVRAVGGVRSGRAGMLRHRVHRPPAVRTRDSEATDEPGTLRGGRLIGPLERVLIFSLTLTGSYAIVAAVIAAKGIVRFPEISRDEGSGSKAEYFLVGSLVSWTTAIAAAGLLWLSAQS